MPALHAPVDSPIYHAHGAEIFPDSDTARYASHFCTCTAYLSSVAVHADQSISMEGMPVTTESRELAVARPWCASWQGPPEHSLSLYACLGRHAPKAWVQSSWPRCCCRRFCAHPGELAAARAFCAAAQERLLRSVCNLGARLPSYIRIAASVHTDVDMFVFSQPALEEGDGGPALERCLKPIP